MISCFAVGGFKFAFRQQLDERFNYCFNPRGLDRHSLLQIGPSETLKWLVGNVEISSFMTLLLDIKSLLG